MRSELYRYAEYCVPAEGPVGPWTLRAAVLVLLSELSLWLEPAPSVWIQDITQLHRYVCSVAHKHANLNTHSSQRNTGRHTEQDPY